MTLLPGTGHRSRTTLLRVAAATWLLLISSAVVVNHVTLSRLSAQAEASAPSTQVAALEARLVELGEQVEPLRKQPAALPQARFESERQALEQRLASIEQALGERLGTDSLAPLQAQLDQLQARLDKPRTTPAPARARTPTAKPKQEVQPPFKVLGIELRGGERFLSILPAGADALPQARVLRPGEVEAGWSLDAIDDRTAVLRSGDGQIRRLAVP